MESYELMSSSNLNDCIWKASFEHFGCLPSFLDRTDSEDEARKFD